MRSEDWKMMGYIGMVLGLIFLAGGAWIWLNVNYYFGTRGWIEYYDYRGYSFPLLISGIVLLVLGYVTNQRAEEEKKRERENRKEEKGKRAREEFKKKNFKFCTHCGEEIPKESEFCPKCGKKQTI